MCDHIIMTNIFITMCEYPNYTHLHRLTVNVDEDHSMDYSVEFSIKLFITSCINLIILQYFIMRIIIPKEHYVKKNYACIFYSKILLCSSSWVFFV